MYAYLNKETSKVVTTTKPLKSENLVEVDAELAFVLEELNKKGYKTKYSCEGHWLTKSQYVSATAEISTPFIMFEDGIKLPSCPAHWRKEIHETIENDDGNVTYGHWESIYSNIVSGLKTPLDFQVVKQRNVKSLIKWAKKL